MGEMADYYMELELARGDWFADQMEQRLDRREDGLYWTTRDGRRLRIAHLEDSHLLNVAHLIERREWDNFGMMINHAPTYRACVNELIKRGIVKDDYWYRSQAERLEVRICSTGLSDSSPSTQQGRQSRSRK